MYEQLEAQCLDRSYKCVFGKAEVGESDYLAAVLGTPVHSVLITLGLAAQRCELLPQGHTATEGQNSAPDVLCYFCVHVPTIGLMIWRISFCSISEVPVPSRSISREG